MQAYKNSNLKFYVRVIGVLVVMVKIWIQYSFRKNTKSKKMKSKHFSCRHNFINDWGHQIALQKNKICPGFLQMVIQHCKNKKPQEHIKDRLEQDQKNKFTDSFHIEICSMTCKQLKCEFNINVTFVDCRVWYLPFKYGFPTDWSVSWLHNLTKIKLYNQFMWIKSDILVFHNLILVQLVTFSAAHFGLMGKRRNVSSS